MPHMGKAQDPHLSHESNHSSCRHDVRLSYCILAERQTSPTKSLQVKWIGGSSVSTQCLVTIHPMPHRNQKLEAEDNWGIETTGPLLTGFNPLLGGKVRPLAGTPWLPTQPL